MSAIAALQALSLSHTHREAHSDFLLCLFLCSKALVRVAVAIELAVAAVYYTLATADLLEGAGRVFDKPDT